MKVGVPGLSANEDGAITPKLDERRKGESASAPSALRRDIRPRDRLAPLGERRRMEVKELTPALWPDLERLFGPRGACGGCWCMYWRLPEGKKWEEFKGAAAKRCFKRLVADGAARGLLAFAEGEPVGWCTFGPRPDFARLDRAPSLACDDADRVWSIPCFFVKGGHRGKGVAGALLGGACAAMKRAGARVVEGYPVRDSRDGKPIPAAFAWTGTLSLFRRAGFRPAGPRGTGKRRMRKVL